MTKVLVTGGSGFVGTNLVQYYASKGCEVLSLDIVPPRDHSHGSYYKSVDICDDIRLRSVVNDFSPNLIMHMAARTDLGGRNIKDYLANTKGVTNLIDVASGLPNLDRVVFASSMLVCRLGYIPKNEMDYCPTTVYGESKVIGEKSVQEFAADRFPWTIVRPTSLWGPWFGEPYRNFFEAVAKRLYMHPRGRQIRRSYGFILNTMHQLGSIGFCTEPSLVDGKTLYLADYQPIELFDWGNVISKHFRAQPPRTVPLWILRGLALSGDVLKSMGVRSPPLSSFRLNNLLTDAVFDMGLLESIAGKCPYEMEQGVEITVDWISKNAERSK